MYWNHKLCTGVFSVLAFIFFLFLHQNTVSGVPLIWDEDKIIEDDMEVVNQDIILSANVTVLENASLSLNNVSIFVDNGNESSENLTYNFTNYGMIDFNKLNISCLGSGKTALGLKLMGNQNQITNSIFNNLSGRKFDNNAGINFLNCSFRLKNLSVNNSELPVFYLKNTSGSISELYFKNSNYYYYLFLSAINCNLQIDNLTLDNGFLYFYDVNGTISDNNFTGCWGSAIKTYGSNLTIHSNYFHSNTIAIESYNSNLTIYSNQFVNSDIGIKTCDSGSFSIHQNNFKNIKGNAIQLEFDGKLDCHDNSFENVSGYHITADVIITLQIDYLEKYQQLINDLIFLRITNSTYRYEEDIHPGKKYIILLPIIRTNDTNYSLLENLRIYSRFHGNDCYYPQDDEKQIDIGSSQENRFHFIYELRNEHIIHDIRIINVSANRKNVTINTEEILIKVLVRNEGVQSAKNMLIFITQINPFSKLEAYKTIREIEPGETKEINFFIKLSVAGEVILEITVNPFRELEEINYEDNSQKINLKVEGHKSLFCGFWMVSVMGFVFIAKQGGKRR